MTERKIIHIDMDAFFVSVELLRQPHLVGKPVAVGGPLPRGVISTASYEARKYGVRSALSTRKAFELCPDLVLLPHHFEWYQAASHKMREIFSHYTDLIEFLSLDEAYLDVSENKKKLQSATVIAKLIKEEIFKETGLTASAGVSINKSLAKIASGYQKPDGLTVIPPTQAKTFASKLPVEKFHGVGKVTLEKMHSLNLKTGQDLIDFGEAQLTRHFGKSGLHFFLIAQAIDDRVVTPYRERKSLGAEHTFDSDLTTQADVSQALEKIIIEVAERLKAKHLAGRTITLKVKYADFIVVNRSRTLETTTQSGELILKEVKELFEDLRWGSETKPIRLLGVSLSNFHLPRKSQQLFLGDVSSSVT